MSSIKTLVNDTPVAEYIASLNDKTRQSEAQELMDIFDKATGMKPKLWGTSIVGYGSYHYKSERSRQEGDWPLIGFSMRKNAITIYIMPGFDTYGELLAKLGKHKTSVGCLYLKKLEVIDLEVLKELIKRVMADMRARYPENGIT